MAGGDGGRRPKRGGRVRLDALLVERGLADSGARAQALIRAGKVSSNTARLDKPGRMVGADIPLAVAAPAHPWVSRGGVKLDHALDRFGLDIGGRVALDIGASTGGFTDVLLSRDAARIYAVDVGRGQLDWGLRNDTRVVVIEGVNARYLGREHVPEPVAVVTCDASFIGLRTILPAPLALVGEDAVLVALIKPQFEVGRARVGKGGIVRDPDLHREVRETIAAWLEAEMGWSVIGIVESPITGPKGNKEFLIAARRR